MEEKILYQWMDMPIGRMLAASTGKGLCWLGLPAEEEGRFLRWAHKKYPGADMDEGDNDVITKVKAQLQEYFDGTRREFSLALDLKGTVFQRRVWHALMQIPYGNTLSYKDIAEAVDKPAAVRAVGQANNRNPIAIIIPCHRVIGSNGKLVGYGGGLDVKRRLLELEGIKVAGDTII